MSTKTYGGFSTRKTPQTEPIYGSPQVANSAGGYSYQIDDWGRLERFLVLGSEGGTYYITEPKLTRENAQAVLRCIGLDGGRTVNIINQVSDAGRAPRQDPALFALALAMSFGDNETKQMGLEKFNSIVRTGTHLYHWVQFVTQFRGKGKTFKRAVDSWFACREPRNLAYQLLKYPSRDGWSARDLLRLRHISPAGDKSRQALYHWAVKGWESVGEAPHPDEALAQIWAAERIKGMTDMDRVADVIVKYQLPREAIPTEMLNSPDVWYALHFDMPIEALVRNLGKMTAVGVLKDKSDATDRVLRRLGDEDALRRARIHPLKLLVALKIYAQGHGVKGDLKWTPVSKLVDALDNAFYCSFAAVEPTGKRQFLGLDVSGSMAAPIAGLPITCAEGTAVLAMLALLRDPGSQVFGFADRIRDLGLDPLMTLDKVMKKISGLTFGGTDCSLPMVYARETKREVDAFIVMTDSETYAGRIHPSQALQAYRRETGIPARLVVAGMTSNGFTIADPDDAGMLDVVGFDTNAPGVMAEFIRA